ncbi:DUF4262 domain-containing protein [Rhizobium leguminosarum]|uniref:DUF4262 domain-containing protein n=1 Tax=Rhizobium leguminosarum TaxID=384 RepID=UPI002E11FDF6|nr:DUF4262 domain-containing protein [Rhizobium leguminosarum]
MVSREILSGLQRYVLDAREKLETMDWLVQGVGADAATPTFSYSVGLSRKYGHPEIAIVGFDPELCRQIINEAGNLVRDHGADFRTPLLSAGIVQQYDVAFRPVASASSREKCRAGKAILDIADYPLVQLFFPDPQGFFPWQRRCDRRYAKIQTGFFKLEGELPNRHGLKSVDAPATRPETGGKHSGETP